MPLLRAREWERLAKRLSMRSRRATKSKLNEGATYQGGGGSEEAPREKNPEHQETVWQGQRQQEARGRRDPGPPKD